MKSHKNKEKNASSKGEKTLIQLKHYKSERMANDSSDESSQESNKNEVQKSYLQKNENDQNIKPIEILKKENNFNTPESKLFSMLKKSTLVQMLATPSIFNSEDKNNIPDREIKEETKNAVVEDNQDKIIELQKRENNSENKKTQLKQNKIIKTEKVVSVPQKRTSIDLELSWENKKAFNRNRSQSMQTYSNIERLIKEKKKDFPKKIFQKSQSTTILSNKQKSVVFDKKVSLSTNNKLNTMSHPEIVEENDKNIEYQTDEKKEVSIKDSNQEDRNLKIEMQITKEEVHPNKLAQNAMKDDQPFEKICQIEGENKNYVSEDISIDKCELENEEKIKSEVIQEREKMYNMTENEKINENLNANTILVNDGIIQKRNTEELKDDVDNLEIKDKIQGSQLEVEYERISKEEINTLSIINDNKDIKSEDKSDIEMEDKEMNVLNIEEHVDFDEKKELKDNINEIGKCENDDIIIKSEENFIEETENKLDNQENIEGFKNEKIDIEEDDNIKNHLYENDPGILPFEPKISDENILTKENKELLINEIVENKVQKYEDKVVSDIKTQDKENINTESDNFNAKTENVNADENVNNIECKEIMKHENITQGNLISIDYENRESEEVMTEKIDVIEEQVSYIDSTTEQISVKLNTHDKIELKALSRDISPEEALHSATEIIQNDDIISLMDKNETVALNCEKQLAVNDISLEKGEDENYDLTKNITINEFDITENQNEKDNINKNDDEIQETTEKIKIIEENISNADDNTDLIKIEENEFEKKEEREMLPENINFLTEIEKTENVESIKNENESNINKVEIQPTDYDTYSENEKKKSIININLVNIERAEDNIIVVDIEKTVKDEEASEKGEALSNGEAVSNGETVYNEKTVDNEAIIDNGETVNNTETEESVKAIYKEVVDNREVEDNEVKVDIETTVENEDILENGKTLNEGKLVDNGKALDNEELVDYRKAEDNEEAVDNAKVNDNKEMEVKGEAVDAGEAQRDEELVDNGETVDNGEAKNKKVTVDNEKLVYNEEGIDNKETIGNAHMLNNEGIVANGKIVDNKIVVNNQEAEDNRITIDNGETVDYLKTVDNAKVVDSGETVDNGESVDNGEAKENEEVVDNRDAEDNRETVDYGKVVDNEKIDKRDIINNGEEIDNGKTESNVKVVDSEDIVEKRKEVDNEEVTNNEKVVDNEEAMDNADTKINELVIFNGKGVDNEETVDKVEVAYTEEVVDNRKAVDSEEGIIIDSQNVELDSSKKSDTENGNNTTESFSNIENFQMSDNSGNTENIIESDNSKTAVVNKETDNNQICFSENKKIKFETEIEGQKKEIIPKPQRKDIKVSSLSKKTKSLSTKSLILDSKVSTNQSHNEKIISSSFSKSISQIKKRESLVSFTHSEKVSFTRRQSDITPERNMKRLSSDYLKDDIKKNNDLETKISDNKETEDTKYIPEVVNQEIIVDNKINEVLVEKPKQSTNNEKNESKPKELNKIDTLNESDYLVKIKRRLSLIEDSNSKESLPNNKKPKVFKRYSSLKEMSIEKYSVAEHKIKKQESQEIVKKEIQEESEEKYNIEILPEVKQELNTIKEISDSSEKEQIFNDTIEKKYFEEIGKENQQENVIIDNMILSTDNQSKLEKHEEIEAQEAIELIYENNFEENILENVNEKKMENEYNENDRNQILKEDTNDINIKEDQYECNDKLKTEALIEDDAKDVIRTSEKDQTNQNTDNNKDNEEIITKLASSNDENLIIKKDIKKLENNKPYVIESWVCDAKTEEGDEKYNINDNVFKEKNKDIFDSSKESPVTENIKDVLKKKISTTSYKAVPMETYLMNSMTNVSQKSVEKRKPLERNKKKNIFVLHPEENKTKTYAIPEKNISLALMDTDIKVPKNKPKNKNRSIKSEKKVKRSATDVNSSQKIVSSNELEFRRIKSNIEDMKIKIQKNKKERKEFVPYLFNNLQPYADTNMYEVSRHQSPRINHGPMGRITAIDLCDPWENHRMDKLPSIRDTSSFLTARSQPRSTMKERENIFSQPVPSLHKKDSDIRIKSSKSVTNSYRSQSHEGKFRISSRRIEDDYKRTRTELYRLSLDKLNKASTEIGQANIRSALFAYLQNSPGSKKALYEVIRHNDRVKTETALKTATLF